MAPPAGVYSTSVAAGLPRPGPLPTTEGAQAQEWKFPFRVDLREGAAQPLFIGERGRLIPFELRSPRDNRTYRRR
jgi:hypothetical protein